ncbi:sodium-dependent phosphate transport protein [Lucifera butyrica]|uniref:Sodium-dependent phosphate transport protein n=1 Tax=Lucifera butyrica TaxID=1351585 RepID=A0A498R959_9FIRM|nr:Na/Pi symporter [Lucifera butyrica]VBB06802.1 sodium-dependent phosphate transport protein [Lucifera butyrica]
MITLVEIFTGTFMLLGGIFGMRQGLQKVFWARLRDTLHKLTVTPWRGLLFGVIASAVLQGSTGLSLITISLVSADYLSFYQGLGIILGANIGTCTTVQLMTLNFPTSRIVYLLLLALVIMLGSKKLRYIAMSAAGLLSMFSGLALLAHTLDKLSSLSFIVKCLLIAKTAPLYGIIGGMAITVLFQSSSAATGILMLLAAEGLIDLTTAAYVIYGNNIGSCLSSLVAGTVSSPAGKQLALAHFLLNILGVILFYPLTHWLTAISGIFSRDFSVQVATMHALFNIISSLIILPFIKQYAALIVWLVPKR